MNSKKTTIKGIIIFLLITFAITVPCSIYMTHEFEETTVASRVLSTIALNAVAFAPMIGAILTRIINKEGFKDFRFRVNLKGNVKYYVLAVILPIVYGFLRVLFLIPSAGKYFTKFTSGEVIDIIFALFTTAATAFLFTYMYLGEEVGWRDYLYPRLEKLMGAPLTVLVGGAIWGLWHAPAYLRQGMGMIEFGFFTGFTIFIGCILFYITKKTGSIYPACILHSFNNNFAAVLPNLFISPENMELIDTSGVLFNLTELAPIVILGAIFFIFIVKDAKKQ